MNILQWVNAHPELAGTIIGLIVGVVFAAIVYPLVKKML